MTSGWLPIVRFDLRLVGSHPLHRNFTTEASGTGMAILCSHPTIVPVCDQRRACWPSLNTTYLPFANIDFIDKHRKGSIFSYAAVELARLCEFDCLAKSYMLMDCCA